MTNKGTEAHRSGSQNVLATHLEKIDLYATYNQSNWQHQILKITWTLEYQDALTDIFISITGWHVCTSCWRASRFCFAILSSLWTLWYVAFTNLNLFTTMYPPTVSIVLSYLLSHSSPFTVCSKSCFMQHTCNRKVGSSYSNKLSHGICNKSKFM